MHDVVASWSIVFLSITGISVVMRVIVRFLSGGVR